MNDNFINYSKWNNFFETIESWDIGYTDINIMNTLKTGTIPWNAGVAERFAKRLFELINYRIDKLNRIYNERLSACNDYFSLSNLLILYRKELKFLKDLTKIPALPEDISNELTTMIIEFAQKIQTDLEKSAKKDLSGEMIRIILGNRLDNI